MSSPQREKRDSPKVGGWGLNAAEKELFRGMEERAIMAFVKESWGQSSSHLKLEALAV